MTLRQIGFSAADFETMTLPDLYLRFCIAYSRSQSQ